MFITEKNRCAYITVLFTLFCAFGLKAQDQPTGAVAIEAVKMNVLYIGVDNPIRIVASGVPAEDLRLQILGAGTIEGVNGEYIVHVTQPGEVVIRVMRKVGGETKFVVDQKYRVKNIPDPIPRLDGRHLGGLMAKDDFLKTKAIVPTHFGFDFDVHWEVLGYELTIVHKPEDPITFHVLGDQIPARAMVMLEGMSGDIDAVFFNDIKVKFGDKDVRNLGSIAFKLKTF